MYKRDFPKSMDYIEIHYPGRINCKEIFPEDSAIEKVFPLKEHRLTINVDNKPKLMQKFVFDQNKDFIFLLNSLSTIFIY